MIYPEPLRKGSRIAVTAFSAGIADTHERRFSEIVRTLEERGYEVIVGDCLKGEHKHVSPSKEMRANELMKFLLDDDIHAIAPPWGGELAIELLPLMDLLDTNTDPLMANTLNYLETTPGETFTQSSSTMHTRNWPAIETDPLAYVVGDQLTSWKWLNKPADGDTISERLIGRCWDTLVHLFGTPYLDLSKLNSTHSEGLLLYLENAEMSPCELVRAIHNMHFRGVFNQINALVLGRNFRVDPVNASHLTYLDVLNKHLLTTTYHQAMKHPCQYLPLFC